MPLMASTGFTGIGLADIVQFKNACHAYFSVSTRPLTNQRCISTTTRTGGRMASIAVTMTRLPGRIGVGERHHLLQRDDDGVHFVVVGDQQRPQILRPAIDEEDDEQRRDIGAATSGSRISLKNRHGPAPSTRAASTSSPGWS
jgi:hypothetical protein